MSIPRPEHYDSLLFACCCKNPLCTDPLETERLWPVGSMISYGKLPGQKYMINWPIEGNDYYVNMIEMDPEQRQAWRQADPFLDRILTVTQAITELREEEL